MLRDASALHIDREVFAQTVAQKLTDLPPLPAVVTRVMQMVNDPTRSADELNRLISLDQGLSSRLLRIVNSAYYGFPRRVSTVTHAIVILGFTTVRNLVMGVSAFGMFAPKSATTGLKRKVFWQHSVAVAFAAGIVAQDRQARGRALQEELFLAGLLHDCGKMFLDTYFPVQYAVTTAYSMRETMPATPAEDRIMGIEHAYVGRKIAEHWNFPPGLVAAIGMHHAPIPTHENFEMACLIHAADWIASSAGYKAVENGPMPVLHDAVREWLGYGEDMLATMADDLQKRLAASREIMAMAQAA